MAILCWAAKNSLRGTGVTIFHFRFSMDFTPIYCCEDKNCNFLHLLRGKRKNLNDQMQFAHEMEDAFLYILAKMKTFNINSQINACIFEIHTWFSDPWLSNIVKSNCSWGYEVGGGCGFCTPLLRINWQFCTMCVYTGFAPPYTPPSLWKNYTRLASHMHPRIPLKVVCNENQGGEERWQALGI
jgi:hypothetical protein